MRIKYDANTFSFTGTLADIDDEMYHGNGYRGAFRCIGGRVRNQRAANKAQFFNIKAFDNEADFLSGLDPKTEIRVTGHLDQRTYKQKDKTGEYTGETKYYQYVTVKQIDIIDDNHQILDSSESKKDKKAA